MNGKMGNGNSMPMSNCRKHLVYTFIIWDQVDSGI